MLFYAENDHEEYPEASIHNIDTGITYMLEAEILFGNRVPVVRMSGPSGRELVPTRLYTGDQAVEFWNALLFRNPWRAANTSPQAFLNKVLGNDAPAASADTDDCPF